MSVDLLFEQAKDVYRKETGKLSIAIYYAHAYRTITGSLAERGELLMCRNGKTDCMMSTGHNIMEGKDI